MGLLNEQMPQEQPQEQMQGQPQGGGTQEQYGQMMTMVLEWLYSEQGVEAIQQGLQISQNPVESIGSIVARLIQKLIIDAKEAGANVPPLMVVQGSIELAQAVTDMAMSAGAVDEQSANQVAKESFYEAMTLVGKDTPPDAFPDGQREEFAGIISQIDAMDNEYEGRSQQPEQPPEEQPQQNPEMMRG